MPGSHMQGEEASHEEVPQIVVSDPYDTDFEGYSPEQLMEVLMRKDGIKVEEQEDPEDHKGYLEEAIRVAVAYVLGLCTCQSERREFTLQLIQSQNPIVQLSALQGLDFDGPYCIRVGKTDVSIWSSEGTPHRDEERKRIDGIFQPLIRDSANPSVRQLAFDRYTRFAQIALNQDNTTGDLDGSVVMKFLIDMVDREIVWGDSSPQDQVQMILSLLRVAADQGVASGTGVSPRELAMYFQEHWNARDGGGEQSDNSKRIVQIVNGFLQDLGHPIRSLGLIRRVIFSPDEYGILRGMGPFSLAGIAFIVKEVQSQSPDDPLHAVIAGAVRAEGEQIIHCIVGSPDGRLGYFREAVTSKLVSAYLA